MAGVGRGFLERGLEAALDCPHTNREVLPAHKEESGRIILRRCMARARQAGTAGEVEPSLRSRSCIM
eukprot:364950-Chlamydomonas_euryale.AAC.10